MESEFFGHVKGSFTGAVNDKKGLFEATNHGTLFLDEIGELSTMLQVKLLRAVQETSFKPVGGTTEIDVDVRIISATNKKLVQKVIEGNFKELENLNERSVTLSSTNIILPESLTISMHKKRRWIEGSRGSALTLRMWSRGLTWIKFLPP